MSRIRPSHTAVAIPDENQDEVLSAAHGGGLNSLGAVFNQMARFGVTLLLARKLGSGQVGVFYEAQAFMALVGLLALSGFRGALTRFVAVHRADGDDASLSGSIRLGLLIPTLASVLMGAALFVLSNWFANEIFHDPGLELALRYVAFALPAASFTDAALSATQGFKTMRPYVAIGLIFEPAMQLALSVVLVSRGLGLPGVMGAVVATSYMAALLAAAALMRLTSNHRARPHYEVKELFSFSAVSWVSSLASSAQTWTATLILGALASSSQVGVYQVATRVTVLATFFLGPIASSFAPTIADLYHRGEIDRLKRLYALVTGWILRLSLPAFVIVILFPGELLWLFGREFRQGAALTVILAVGHLFNVAGGPNGYMLVMSGRPGLTMANNIAALIVNVALNLLLVPRFGVLGAGIAFATSVAFSGIAKMVQVWFTMQMHPIDTEFWKACVAATAAFGAGLIAGEALEGAPARLVAALGLALMYFGVIALLGVGPGDRLVLGRLWRRLRPGHS